MAMTEDKMLNLQAQLRHNQADLGDFLKDLDSWTDDIKVKDEELKVQDSSAKTVLPPVRNSLDKKRKKKKKKQPKVEDSREVEKMKRIKGYDFRAWDKFDVDKACEEIDNSKSSSSEYETDEEWEAERKKQQAIVFKDQGNQCFKEGKYDEAVECYTRGIECDSSNAVLPANRAMALLKQEKYAAAELDCTRSIFLDESYMKAYLRRGTARAALKKYEEAKEDFMTVLKIEPKNKQAKAELEKVDRLINPPKILQSENLEADDEGIVKAVYKPPGQRSQKPLLRIPIEEIGIEETIIRAPQASKTKQRIEAQDREKFDQNFLKTDTVEKTQMDIELDEAKSTNLRNKITEITNQVVKMDVQDESDSLKLDLPQPSDSVKMDVSSPNTSPRVPPVPSTSFQFQTDFRVLKNTTEQFYQYLQAIDPVIFPTLFGQAMESDMLMKILTTLQDSYIPQQKPIFPVLLNLTKVKRFDMTVMFMSATEKQVIKILFDAVQAEDISKDELAKLRKKYGL